MLTHIDLLRKAGIVTEPTEQNIVEGLQKVMTSKQIVRKTPISKLRSRGSLYSGKTGISGRSLNS
jgi:hypothetical protein